MCSKAHTSSGCAMYSFNWSVTPLNKLAQDWLLLSATILLAEIWERSLPMNRQKELLKGILLKVVVRLSWLVSDGWLTEKHWPLKAPLTSREGENIKKSNLTCEVTVRVYLYCIVNVPLVYICNTRVLFYMFESACVCVCIYCVFAARVHTHITQTGRHTSLAHLLVESPLIACVNQHRPTICFTASSSAV